jgi:uncharacterized membrane protein YebE (DUF533 family)
MQSVLIAGILDASSRFGEEGGYQTIGDVLAGGFPVFLVGLLTVFAVLAIIWGVLEVFHYLAYTLPHKKMESKKNASSSTPAESLQEDASIADAIPTQPQDEEIVAVIAAAIAAAEADHPNGQFRVVSFRKK